MAQAIRTLTVEKRHRAARLRARRLRRRRADARRVPGRGAGHPASRSSRASRARSRRGGCLRPRSARTSPAPSSRRWRRSTAAGSRDALAEQRREAYEALAEEGIDRETGRVEHAARPALHRPGVHADDPAAERRRAARRDFVADLQRRFDETHEADSATATPERRSSSSPLRSTALGDLGRIEPNAPDAQAAAGDLPVERKDVVFDGRRAEAAIVRRDDLPVGVTWPAPPSSSRRPPPPWCRRAESLTVDAYGALVLQINAERDPHGDHLDQPHHHGDRPQRLHRRRGRDERDPDPLGVHADHLRDEGLLGGAAVRRPPRPRASPRGCRSSWATSRSARSSPRSATAARPGSRATCG